MEYELSYNLRKQLTLNGIFAILKLNSSETARFFLQVQRNRFLTECWLGLIAKLRDNYSCHLRRSCHAIVTIVFSSLHACVFFLCNWVETRRYICCNVSQGVKLTFFSDSHLAPKFFKVVANSKKVGRHFQRQTKSLYAVSVLDRPSKINVLQSGH